ncbi:MAG: transglutaminase-like cysteine peptidase [Methylobacteriaceae bacterium]|nr:transglutaminase-like cysteine peptidase [Methylobacteriaceae bacterium]MBV9243488.1 transglutaminase-like cysteine peptidase [Methylobacteriaceae bacterium]
MVRFGVLLGFVAFVGLFGPAAAGSRSAHARIAALATAPPATVRLPARTTSAIAGSETTVPFGWIDFCRRYAGECDVEPMPAADVTITAATWAKIDRINRFVNGAIEPVSDMDHWGVIDQWDYPLDAKGDCEDYALLKRKLLIEAGLPRQALLMTVVRDHEDQGHALLTVKTNGGDYVLDNLSDEIKPWSSTGYRFVKRQSQENPDVWLTLRGPDVPDVAATK